MENHWEARMKARADEIRYNSPFWLKIYQAAPNSSISPVRMFQPWLFNHLPLPAPPPWYSGLQSEPLNPRRGQQYNETNGPANNAENVQQDNAANMPPGWNSRCPQVNKLNGSPDWSSQWPSICESNGQPINRSMYNGQQSQGPSSSAINTVNEVQSNGPNAPAGKIPVNSESNAPLNWSSGWPQLNAPKCRNKQRSKYRSNKGDERGNRDRNEIQNEERNETQNKEQNVSPKKIFWPHSRKQAQQLNNGGIGNQNLELNESQNEKQTQSQYQKDNAPQSAYENEHHNKNDNGPQNMEENNPQQKKDNEPHDNEPHSKENNEPQNTEDNKPQNEEDNKPQTKEVNEPQSMEDNKPQNKEDNGPQIMEDNKPQNKECNESQNKDENNSQHTLPTKEQNEAQNRKPFFTQYDEANDPLSKEQFVTPTQEQNYSQRLLSSWLQRNEQKPLYKMGSNGVPYQVAIAPPTKIQNKELNGSSSLVQDETSKEINETSCQSLKDPYYQADNEPSYLAFNQSPYQTVNESHYQKVNKKYYQTHNGKQYHTLYRQKVVSYQVLSGSETELPVNAVSAQPLPNTESMSTELTETTSLVVVGNRAVGTPWNSPSDSPSVSANAECGDSYPDWFNEPRRRFGMWWPPSIEISGNDAYIEPKMYSFKVFTIESGREYMSIGEEDIAGEMRHMFMSKKIAELLIMKLGACYTHYQYMTKYTSPDLEFGKSLLGDTISDDINAYQVEMIVELQGVFVNFWRSSGSPDCEINRCSVAFPIDSIPKVIEQIKETMLLFNLEEEYADLLCGSGGGGGDVAGPPEDTCAAGPCGGTCGGACGGPYCCACGGECGGGCGDYCNNQT